MKTKTFLLLCLFLGIGLTKTSGQLFPPPPDNKTFTGSIVVVQPMDYLIPVYLEVGDETALDYLAGPGTAHFVYKYHKGVLITADYTWKSSELQFVFGTSDEVFKVSDVGKQDIYEIISDDPLIPIIDGYSFFKVNIIGNKGTHYKTTATFDWLTWGYTWEKIVWLGKKN
jgi:hypothetical protein